MDSLDFAWRNSKTVSRRVISCLTLVLRPEEVSEEQWCNLSRRASGYGFARQSLHSVLLTRNQWGICLFANRTLPRFYGRAKVIPGRTGQPKSNSVRLADLDTSVLFPLSAADGIA